MSSKTYETFSQFVEDHQEDLALIEALKRRGYSHFEACRIVWNIPKSDRQGCISGIDVVSIWRSLTRWCARYCPGI